VVLFGLGVATVVVMLVLYVIREQPPDGAWLAFAGACLFEPVRHAVKTLASGGAGSSSASGEPPSSSPSSSPAEAHDEQHPAA
jgi:hypothetical protein